MEPPQAPQPCTCNPHTLNSEGFIKFLHRNKDKGRYALSHDFRLERKNLLRDIADTLAKSIEAVQSLVPGKTLTGLTECRDALAELRANRLSLPTVPGIAYAASHDCHECNSSCDEIICKVNPIITNIDSLGLRAAAFVDTYFKLKYHLPRDPRDKKPTSLYYVTIPDADSAGEWIRRIDDYPDNAITHQYQGFHKSGAARLASTLMCPSAPDMRYPWQDGENIWAALTGVTKSAESVRYPNTRQQLMGELQSLCGAATDSLERSESLDEETLKTKWSTILSKAQEYLNEVSRTLSALRPTTPPAPVHTRKRHTYLEFPLDIERTPLPGSWLARLASSNNLSVSVQAGPVSDPSDFDGQDGNIDVQDQSDSDSGGSETTHCGVRGYDLDYS